MTVAVVVLAVQRELSGRSVSDPGLDHVELYHIPPPPCSRKSQRRGAGHQQETQLTGVATEEEKARSVCVFLIRFSNKLSKKQT